MSSQLKQLIAVTTCHPFRDRADAVRQTWGAEVEGADIRYFLGSGEVQRPDEVILDCPDGYHYLSQKTQLIRRWALANGYGFVWKIDDDTYVRPERLLGNGFAALDYVGRLRGASGNLRGPYCSGFCYGLSRKAMELLAPIEWAVNEDFSEDRWTGNRLLSLGISPHNESQFVVQSSKSCAISGREAPLVGNAVIASCEYSPDQMRAVHAEFKSGKRSNAGEHHQPAGSLSRVSVMVKTFLRDGHLFACLDGLEKNFSDTKIVVVDDGWETGMNHTFNKITRAADMRRRGHAWLNLPFDSGFGEKANAAIPECSTKEYVLIASDDFDFSQPGVREGVEAMQKVLDAVPSLAIVSGRVDGNSYEFCWEAGEKSLREIPRYHGSGEVDGAKYHLCDLTVNYSLIRTKVFEGKHGGIRWDGGDVKIGGGEHSAFFIDLQRSYWGVAYVEGANITQIRPDPLLGWQHTAYPSMRARARSMGRPCLKRRGVDVYVLANGTAEVS
jgi:hypothetical protein